MATPIDDDGRFVSLADSWPLRSLAAGTPLWALSFVDLVAPVTGMAWSVAGGIALVIYSRTMRTAEPCRLLVPFFMRRFIDLAMPLIVGIAVRHWALDLRIAVVVSIASLFTFLAQTIRFDRGLKNDRLNWDVLV